MGVILVAEDQYGYDGWNGYNNWRRLQSPYSGFDFIFQQIEDSKVTQNKLFRLVKVPEAYQDLLNKVYDEMTVYRFDEEIEKKEGPDGQKYSVEIVWLSGRYDSGPPEELEVGADDIVRDKLDAWKTNVNK